MTTRKQLETVSAEVLQYEAEKLSISGDLSREALIDRLAHSEQASKLTTPVLYIHLDHELQHYLRRDQFQVNLGELNEADAANATACKLATDNSEANKKTLIEHASDIGWLKGSDKLAKILGSVFALFLTIAGIFGVNRLSDLDAEVKKAGDLTSELDTLRKDLGEQKGELEDVRAAYTRTILNQAFEEADRVFERFSFSRRDSHLAKSVDLTQARLDRLTPITREKSPGRAMRAMLGEYLDMLRSLERLKESKADIGQLRNYRNRLQKPETPLQLSRRGLLSQSNEYRARLKALDAYRSNVIAYLAITEHERAQSQGSLTSPVLLDLAKSQLESAIRLNPDFARAHSNLGVQEYQRLMAITPKKELYRSWPPEKRGEWSDRANQHLDRAIRHFEEGEVRALDDRVRSVVLNNRASIALTRIVVQLYEEAQTKSQMEVMRKRMSGARAALQQARGLPGNEPVIAVTTAEWLALDLQVRALERPLSLTSDSFRKKRVHRIVRSIEAARAGGYTFTIPRAVFLENFPALAVLNSAEVEEVIGAVYDG